MGQLKQELRGRTAITNSATKAVEQQTETSFIS